MQALLLVIAVLGVDVQLFQPPAAPVIAAADPAPPAEPQLSPGEQYLAGLKSPCVVMSTSNWCGPCRWHKTDQRGFVQRLKKVGWHVEFLDIDKNPEIAESLGIDALPTFIVVRKHKEFGRKLGSVDWMQEFRPLLIEACKP
jgi:thiol-disulfide isomerase/thioredoxin